MSKESFAFDGFTPPVSNYYRMPNEWVNISAKITNLAELKVVEYVLRHTWGFQEYDGKPKPITIDEFMHGRKDRHGNRLDDGTGLSKPSVIQGLKYAIEHGYLICEVDDTDKARIVKAYALKMLSCDSEVKDLYPQTRGKESLPQMSNIFTPEVKNLYPRGKTSLPRSEKETKERHFKKEREKDSVVPTSAEELPTSPQPEASFSLSLSQKNDSSFSSSPEEKPTKEAKPTPVDYALFDALCRKKGYASDFKVPRNEKNNAALQELRQQGANAEQVEFVFNDIWDDKDSFWQQHRGKPSTVASQFTARVWKMTQPAQKRRTASGFTNWTEDKSVGAPAIVEPVASKAASVPASVPVSTPETKTALETKPTPMPAIAKPKEFALPVGYTRLKIDKPARPRTAYGRRLQAEKEAHSI